MTAIPHDSTAVSHDSYSVVKKDLRGIIYSFLLSLAMWAFILLGLAGLWNKVFG